MEYSRIKEVNERLRPMLIERKTKGGVVSKEYNTVDQRIQGFRELYPDGSIQPEIINLTETLCVIKATAYDDTGKIIATGHAQEIKEASYINETSYVENCETSAIGRCLGVIGIGITEGIASVEEMEAQKEAEKKRKDDLIKVALEDLKKLYEQNGGTEWDKYLKDVAPDGMTNDIYKFEVTRLKKEITDKAEAKKGDKK